MTPTSQTTDPQTGAQTGPQTGPPWLADLARPIAHIVHIGAGAGSDLAAYLAAGAGMVTLVEAEAQAVTGLETLADDTPRVRVIEAAVSGDGRKRAFRLTNFPDLNSFRAPTGLKDLFPGLRTLSEDPVTPVDPAHLIGDLDLSAKGAPGTNLLVIEAPGEALGILEALAAAQLLERFDMVRLQEGRTALYDGAPTVADSAAFLTGAGFAAHRETAPQDPERPYLVAQQDHPARAPAPQAGAGAPGRAADMRAQLKARAEQVENLKIERDTSKQRATQLQDRVSEQARQLKTLRTEQEEANKHTVELRAELAAAQAAPANTEQQLRQCREEMLKAEGQIGLIRDLLLRGPEL